MANADDDLPVEPSNIVDPFIDPVRDRVPCDHERQDAAVKKPAKPKRRQGKRINAKQG